MDDAEYDDSVLAEEARAQGWPPTARAAARKAIESPSLSRFGGLTLTAGSPADDGAVQFAAVDSDGRRVAILTVQELVAGAWAVTPEDACSE